jgi:hypothetical protein
VFNHLEFPVGQLNEVQLIGPQHFLDAECKLINKQSSLAIKYLYENKSLIQFWGSEDCKKFPSLQLISLKCLVVLVPLFVWKLLFGNELHQKQTKNKIEPIPLRSPLNISEIFDNI